MTSRRSHPFQPASEDWGRSMELYLLYEDFVNRLVPYRHEPEAYELVANGISNNHLDEALALWDYEEGLDGFVRVTASRLLSHHEVWLEVAFSDENQGHVPFRVFEIGGVKRTKAGNLIQEPLHRDELPDWYEVRDEWHTEIELDTDRMVHVLLPDDYPSKLLTGVVRDLEETDSDIIPGWVMNRLAEQGRTAPYDSGEASRIRQLRIAQAALPIGWTGREILNSNRYVSDYYHYSRELRFLHFLSSVRARAEEAVRQVLTLAGERCGFEATVNAYGVHTPLEVERFIREFEAGELAFSVVNDIIFENVKDTQLEPRRVL